RPSRLPLLFSPSASFLCLQDQCGRWGGCPGGRGPAWEPSSLPGLQRG
ncbi:hypothetical protein J1605_010397, partial [Eschrichtius robustus]